MAEPEGVKEEKQEKLLTLSEVSNRTSISMPTLQRYKKLYQSRIPSVGKGRRQRYPEEALEVFEAIKKENIGKRGRPRKKDAAKAAAKRPRSAGRKGGTRRARGADGRGAEKARKDLLTLTQISETTGISYPTLVRYVKLYGDRLPHEGEGRRRRFYPEAVDVFRQLRQESSRGRQKKAASRGGRPAAAAADGSLARRVQSLERSQDRLEKQIRALIKSLQKPLKVTIQRK